MGQSTKGARHPGYKVLVKRVDDKSDALRLVEPYKYAKRSVLLLLILIVLSILALMFVPWQQTSFGSGQIVPYDPSERLQVINAQVKGVISEWYVKEGQKVAEGDPLVAISDIDPNLIQRLETQLNAAKTALDAAKTAVETSNKNLVRQKKLSDKGLKSQRDYELSRLEYTKFVAQVAAKRKELQEVQTKLARQSSQLINAPRSGTIMRIFFPEGQTFVKDGEPLALLAPETRQGVVELFIDGIDLPLVSIDRKVRLVFEGWPSIQFSGWPSVAVGTFGGEVKIIDPSDNGSGKFRVLVFPDKNDIAWPGPQYLRQGVRVKGWIMLDVVPLWYEVWRKFNDFPPTVQLSPKKGEEKAKKKPKF